MRHFRQRPPAYAPILSALFLVLVCVGGCGGVSNVAAGAPQAPTAGVTAGPTARDVTTYSASIRVPEYGSGTRVSVSCPAGAQMIGGGFAASDTFEYAAIIAASYPASATTWTVAATSSPAFILSAEVYCVRTSIELGVRIVHAAAAPTGGAVACSAGSVLLSGGFQAGGPAASRPEGNGWYEGATRSTGQVYALCASQHVRAGSVVSARFNPHSSAHSYYPAGQSVNCPADQIATAGGFSGGGLIITSASVGAPYHGWSVIAGGDGDVTVIVRCVSFTA